MPRRAREAPNNAPAKTRTPRRRTATGEAGGPALGAAVLRRGMLDRLATRQARFPAVATRNDWYLALAYTVRDHLLTRWVRTANTYFDRASRTVCYFSAEYLIGQQLGLNLLQFGIADEARTAAADLGLDLDALLDEERDPGLGAGGLGRLAACFMESLATQQIPAIGYGIRYEFGIFTQLIRDGWQVERADGWLRPGNPWETARPEIAFEVNLGGRVERAAGAGPREPSRWIPDRVVRGVAYDTPILGYQIPTANLLRLWKAEASQALDLGAFQAGDYYGAVHQTIASETLSKVLYPNDEPAAGKELRLAQQYFFVSCSLQDMIRIHRQRDPSLAHLDRKYAAQLNDTHPAIAVAELVRLLVDEHGMPWEQAWDITRRVFAYTNHTLLPEALETWPVSLFGSLLPRHLEIVYEINQRFLDEVRAARPGDEALVERVSLIAEGPERRVRMAHLAVVGSRKVNGVARLHGELLRERVLGDFHALWPEKFTHVTNGVTPRRFVALCNPRLSRLITRAIGDGWVRDLDRLQALEPLADDAAFRAEWREVKRRNKEDLAAWLASPGPGGSGEENSGASGFDAGTLLDVHAKRIHEYKRQHLKLLHVASLYHRLLRDPGTPLAPRTVLLAGKAAPGYATAKLMIKLAHAIAARVNADPAAQGRLRVLFVPDYSVRVAHHILPAADLSEQISTAGTEASGTGNMKFALNGALTVGTLDGANVEMREAVGEENFFLFGLTTEEVAGRAAGQGPSPREIAEADPELREALDLVAGDFFAPGSPGLFAPLSSSLADRDPYLVLADFRAYADCQERIEKIWHAPERWTRMSILTVARMGGFSSDRAVREYAANIWEVEPVAPAAPEKSGTALDPARR